MALGATGTHPWADYREQSIIDTEHYRRLDRGLGYAVWRNNTFSLHVHVGIRGAERAVLVCDRMRAVLPLLLAISANSPYLDGRDSRLHSARTESFTRVFPRCGIPDAFGGWDAYAEYVDFLARTNSIIEYTQVWWSVRPHTGFGTVEVRICDAQATAPESEGLAALIAACIAQAARDIDEGRSAPDPPHRLVEENLWRATRHGLDGKLIDLERGEEYPAADVTARLLAWTEPARAELGLEPGLPDANGAQRQRRMIDAGATHGRRVRGQRARDPRDLCPGGGGMTDSTTSTTGGGDPSREPSEEEVRAALEAEMKRISVDDVVLQTVVSLVNLAGRRAGLAPGTEDERDLEQVRTAIDAVRALLPLVERNAEVAEGLGPIRDALSKLQMAYVELTGSQPGEQPAEPAKPDAPAEAAKPGEAEAPGEPGPAQSSGRLWIPGR